MGEWYTLVLFTSRFCGFVYVSRCVGMQCQPASQPVDQLACPSHSLALLAAVHRIGRTGRGEQCGLATTFINKSVDETTLLDLKHLLLEAKQPVPEFLTELATEHELEMGGEVGCAYCGGLGHRITHCPKLEAMQNKAAGNLGRKDFLSSADY